MEVTAVTVRRYRVDPDAFGSLSVASVTLWDMRQFLKEVRFAIVDAWRSRGRRKLPVDDSLARTLKDASHATRAGSMGAAGRTNPSMIATDGAERYAKSFEDGA